MFEEQRKGQWEGSEEVGEAVERKAGGLPSVPALWAW